MALFLLNKAVFFGVVPIAIFLYGVGNVVYNIFFHPLRRYPGPWLMRASRIGYCYRQIRGTLPFDMLDLHQKYGTVVRIAPNELAFADPAAWRDIMGHRAHGQPELEKWERFYRPIDDLPTDIVNAGREEHGLLRRQLAHGFSDRSMREQQPLIGRYIDLLIKKLHERCGGGGRAVDLAAWYNYTTFDIIGDLAFGEAFGCLDNSDYHPWVRSIFQMARVGTIFQALSHVPFLTKFLLAIIPKSAMEERERHMEFTKAKLMQRIALGEGRPDLIQGLLKKKDEWNFSIEKLQANSSILIIGGSETTATLLSGLTFLLLTNPESLLKLTNEVRSTFKKEEDIDFTTVSNMSYLLACIDEALRMYPPVPTGLPRVVPRGGVSVCGNYIPENTIVAIHQWALYHNTANFKDPFSYHPERFLGDDRFASDRRDALQPFHLGARNCLGRNLAYVEMRLIICRILFNFDLRIAEESRDWMDRQKIYNLWNKGELKVYLTPVSHE